MKKFHYRYDFGQNHLNYIITTIVLEPQKVNSFSRYIFYEIQLNGQYNSYLCQIEISGSS